MNRIATGIVLLLVLTQTLAVAQQQQPESTNVGANLLSRNVSWREPESTETDIALVSDLETARIPGGMFRARKCGDVEPKLIPAKDSTFQDELNRIANVKPEYQWAIDNGVFNFFPKFFTPSPLDISIAEFKVENEQVIQAYRKLLDTPDIKNGFARLGLHEPAVQVILGGISTPPNIGGGSDPPHDPKRITLNLKNTTLREASNAIVRADGQKTWVLSVVSCKGDNTYASQLVN